MLVSSWNDSDKEQSSRSNNLSIVTIGLVKRTACVSILRMNTALHEFPLSLHGSTLDLRYC